MGKLIVQGLPAGTYKKGDVIPILGLNAPKEGIMGKVVDLFKNHKGKVGALLGFVSGLVAGKYPAIAATLDELAKVLGAQ